VLFDRVRKLNSAEASKNGRYVLYWAQMNRRLESNHALSFAVDMATELNLPILFYEGLTCSYPHANDRFHTLLVEGVPGTARRLRALNIVHATSSSVPRPTTPSGTPPKPSCSREASFTGTIGCTGARKSSNGRPLTRMRSTMIYFHDRYA
jgi:hypothetical protein